LEDVTHVCAPLRFRNQRTDRGSQDPDRFTKDQVDVDLVVTCCLVHQAREVTSGWQQAAPVGFHRPHGCATNWMGALIAGTRPSCASNLDVVLAGRIPAQGRGLHPWVDAAETAPLFTRFSGCAKDGVRWSNRAGHLSARPLAGRLGGWSRAYRHWAQGRRNDPHICTLRSLGPLLAEEAD
jgi:hypothetical protein